jgi:hypothetical protein
VLIFYIGGNVCVLQSNEGVICATEWLYEMKAASITVAKSYLEKARRRHSFDRLKQITPILQVSENGHGFFFR